MMDDGGSSPNCGQGERSYLEQAVQRVLLILGRVVFIRNWLRTTCGRRKEKKLQERRNKLQNHEVSTVYVRHCTDTLLLSSNVKAIQRITETELTQGQGRGKKSWHDMYTGSAYVFIGKAI